jgi:hypothetical protein
MRDFNKIEEVLSIPEEEVIVEEEVYEQPTE